MLANSFLHGEDAVNLRNVFAVFESASEHSKRQRLRFRDGFIARSAVRDHPWNQACSVTCSPACSAFR